MSKFQLTTLFQKRSLSSLLTPSLVLLLAFGSSAVAQDQDVEKGTPVQSRDLTEAEINFVNFGDISPANSITPTAYPEYSDDIFLSMANDVGAFSFGETVRLLVTVEPNIDRSFGFNALSDNAISRKDEVIQALAGSTTTIVNDFADAPVLLIEIEAQSIQQLATIDAIGAVELDRQVAALHTSSIPVINARDLQLHSTTGAGYQGGNGAWGVAVLDTGILSSHSAFRGRIASEACFVSDNSCPNGTNTMIGPGAASNCGGAGGRCAHGTHVSGTSAGEFTDTGLLNFDGVAPGADIHAIQVFDAFAQGAYNSDIFSGLQHVYNMVLNGSRIASVNMSLGTFSTFSGNCDFYSPSINAMAATLRQNGVLVVAASGNSSSSTGLSFPACISAIVSVGNTWDNDVVNQSSNASTDLDLYAPGTNITSASDAGDTSLVTYTGTSMAAPHVAGAAAMLRECYVSAAGSLASQYVDDVLLSTFRITGDEIVDPRIGSNYSIPRLNMAASGRAIRGNDTFASARQIGAHSGSYLAANTCATHEAGEPNHGTSNIASVWFDHTVPATGAYTFDTCDNATSFDTTISVYSGDTISALTRLAFDDDACGLKSRVTVNANAGQSLKIAVGGSGTANEIGNTGVFNLKWTYQPLLCHGLEATIIGTAFGDALPGTVGDDVIMGLGGNDNISGFGGNDTICGGIGNDNILGGIGDDWIDGGDGNDTVKGQQGNDTIFGGNGADTLRGSQGNDSVDGGAGNDDVNGGWGNDFVKGGPDDDIVDGDIGDDVLRGSQGNDTLDGGDGDDHIDGGWDNDAMKGGPGDDILAGNLGNDIIRGSLGNDVIDGGDGNDNIDGGWGNDFLKGGPGNDRIDGNIGNDILRGSKGDDILIGGTGNDTFNGGVHTVRDTCYIEAADITAPVACEIVL